MGSPEDVVVCRFIRRNFIKAAKTAVIARKARENVTIQEEIHARPSVIFHIQLDE
jgi:hypothetical protein